MRRPSPGPLRLRLLLSIGALLFAGPGCSCEPSPSAGPSDAQPSSETASTGAIASPALASAQESTRWGAIAGVRYIEHMTGGARSDERAPMIVALHPMGGDPADLLDMFRRYRRRARFILPYGHPSGGMYIWYNSVRDDVAAPLVTEEANRITAAITALTAALPTVGKPIVTGFSQGGIMAFALAVTHPEALTAAFPISGLLPLSLYPYSAPGSGVRPAALPPIMAFHGAADMAVPVQGARDSIAELRRAGYKAELREYAGLEHDTSDEEVVEILERIGRVADGLTSAAEGP